MNLLSPAPEFRVPPTLPPADGLSPEAQDGRLQGKEEVILTQKLLQKEEPWHTVAAQCYAMRMTRNEVAAFVEKDPATVSLLARSPWFQSRVREFMLATHTKISDLFTSELVPSFLRLVELRDDAKTPKPVVLACIQEILNRNLGKPLQRVESDNTYRAGDPVAEVERLKNENATLRVPSLS